MRCLTLTSSLALAALCLGCAESPTEISDGSFSLTWSIVVDGQVGTCAEVGATTVEVISSRVGSGSGISDRFSCTSFAGTTDPLPAGEYTVVVKLLDAGNVQLNSVDIVLTEQLLAGDVVILGNFAFAFLSSTATFTMQVGQGQFGHRMFDVISVAEQLARRRYNTRLERSTAPSYQL